MNNQEAFDLMVNHIIAQGKPSINKMGDCMYRGQDNAMCAVGILIPDDKYTPAMENLNPYQLVEHYGLDFGDVETGFLHEAQDRLHDTPACEPHDNFVAEVKDNAQALARKWKLKCSI